MQNTDDAYQKYLKENPDFITGVSILKKFSVF